MRGRVIIKRKAQGIWGYSVARMHVQFGAYTLTGSRLDWNKSSLWNTQYHNTLRLRITPNGINKSLNNQWHFSRLDNKVLSSRTFLSNHQLTSLVFRKRRNDLLYHVLFRKRLFQVVCSSWYAISLWMNDSRQVWKERTTFVRLICLLGKKTSPVGRCWVEGKSSPRLHVGRTRSRFEWKLPVRPGTTNKLKSKSRLQSC